MPTVEDLRYKPVLSNLLLRTYSSHIKLKRVPVSLLVIRFNN